MIHRVEYGYHELQSPGLSFPAFVLCAFLATLGSQALRLSSMRVTVGPT